VQADGKIVAAQDLPLLIMPLRNQVPFPQLLRYNADGTADASFGSNGAVTLASTVKSLAIQPDGKIVVAGPMLQRFNVNGSLDSTFGMVGQTPLFATASPNFFSAVPRVAVEPDGAIVVSVSNTATGSLPSLTVYKSNGNRELHFGSSGQVIVDFGSGAVNGMAIQPDGKIVVVGNSTSGLGHSSTAVARYLVSGGPSPTANELFVRQLYLDLLQRPGEAAGMAGWVAALDQGASRLQVVQAFQSSPEYHTVVVRELYRLVFGRAVDPSGQMTWVSFLNRGGTAEQLEAILLGSDEFFATHGSDNNQGFLPGLYQIVLQRPIDSSGAQSWGQVLQSGALSRRGVAAAILASLESDQLEVSTAYFRLLHRMADPDGFTIYRNALQQGLTDAQLVAILISSAEYFEQL
jgi:uncharacterized delta-60 repeat protein